MNSSGVFQWSCGAAVLVLAASGWSCRSAGSEPASANTAASSSATVTVRRGTFTRTVRVAGITEAVRNAAADRAAPGGPDHTRTSSSRNSSRAAPARRRATCSSSSTRRTRSAPRSTAAPTSRTSSSRSAGSRRSRRRPTRRDETAMTQAENDVSRARARGAEEPRPARHRGREEHAGARGGPGAADRGAAGEDAQAPDGRGRHANPRDPARAAWSGRSEHAEQNAAYMVVRAPFDGLAVVQPVFKGSAMTEVQEGDEVRPGMPIVNVVDPTSMQVRARVSQVDAGLVAVGQPVRVTLDAYPGVSFDGTVKQVAPLAITSSVTPAVRGFVAIISIAGLRRRPDARPVGGRRHRSSSGGRTCSCCRARRWRSTRPARGCMLKQGGSFVRQRRHGRRGERRPGRRGLRRGRGRRRRAPRGGR